MTPNDQSKMESPNVEKHPLRVLILEDEPTDAALMVHELRRAGFEPDWQRVETEGDYLAQLDSTLDIILADYSLPQFDSLRALQLLQGRGLDVPFLIVSGTIGEEIAVSAMREGAADYLLKDRLARLGPAVANALEQKRLRRERQQAEAALRASEARFRALIEHSSDGIALINPEGVVQYASPSTLRILGYGVEKAIGRCVLELIHPDERESVQKLLEACIQNPGTVLGVEHSHRLLHKDGTWRWLEGSVNNLLAEPSVQAIVINYRDITERKRAEVMLQEKDAEIRAMSQQLWQAAKLATMGELAANIAHELNNPLATVSLRVESLLAQLPAEDPKQRALKVVEQEVERMGTLVTNLLQFSRRAQPRISTLNVCEEIGNALELIQHNLRNRQIEVMEDYAPDVPLIQADSQQVRQLFLNLFTNAADAMPQGGTLMIRVSATEQNVLIEVADTGMGIAPADLPKIMEPFFTTKPEGKGTGLGLAICRRIVHEHGGTFRIDSEGLGKGATVHLTLPRQNPENGTFLKDS